MESSNSSQRECNQLKRKKSIRYKIDAETTPNSENAECENENGMKMNNIDFEFLWLPSRELHSLNRFLKTEQLKSKRIADKTLSWKLFSISPCD